MWVLIFVCCEWLKFLSEKHGVLVLYEQVPWIYRENIENWGKMLAEGWDPYREQLVFGGLVLRPLHHIWAPSSSVSQLLVQQNLGSSCSVFLPSYSRSAVEKTLLLRFRNYEVTFLQQGRGDGSSPLWSVRSRPLPVPCRRRHRSQDGERSRSSGWVTALLSVQHQLLQKHNFHRYHHFLCLSWHLVFCFLTLYFGLVRLALALLLWRFDGWGSESRRSRQPTEIHIFSAFDGCSLGFPARIWFWETNLSLGCCPEFVFYWSDEELWKRLPVSRAAFTLGWYVGWFVFFFFFFFVFLFCFSF